MNEMQIKKYLIEAVKFSFNYALPRYFCKDLAQIDAYLKDYGNEMVLSLDAYVASHIVDRQEISATATATVTASIQFPSTLFQHFKQEYFPNWLLKKYPVKYTTLSKTTTDSKTVTETFEIKQCFPDMIMTNDRYYVAAFKQPTKVNNYVSNFR